MVFGIWNQMVVLLRYCFYQLSKLVKANLRISTEFHH